MNKINWGALSHETSPINPHHTLPHNQWENSNNKLLPFSIENHPIKNKLI